MVYCLQATLAFSTAGRRNSILSAIENRIVGKTRWGVEVTQAQAVRAGDNGLVADLRFVSQLDQADLRAFIESQATGQNTPLTGSRVLLHDCPHDEGVGFCTSGSEVVW